MKPLVFLMVIMFSSQALAKDEIIENGFKSFKEGGAEAAWSTWSKGGPLEGSKDLMAQASQFGSIGAYYGDYVGHEYVSEKILGPRNKIVYVIMNLETGPVYGIFNLYKTSKGNWAAPNFLFHTQPQQIWPANIYSNCSE